jgi:hypothetical protein
MHVAGRKKRALHEWLDRSLEAGQEIPGTQQLNLRLGENILWAV